MSADRYLADVEAHLTDLPWRVRKDLAADLRVHLVEVLAGEDLVARLGSPESYAAELRAAAGLQRQRGLRAFLRARRPRNLVIAGVLLLFAAAAAVAVAWARSYQPLATGSIGLSPLVSRQGAVGETVAPFLNDRPFQYGVSIRNAGRFPVRILDIPLDPASASPYEVRAYLGPSELGEAKPPGAFHPFTLDPGHERLIVLRGAYANCDKWVSGSSVGVSAIPIRERFLFWTRTVWIDLLDPLVIRMPDDRSPCSTG